MSQLICNLPNTKVYVRKEFLRDGKDGHGEFVEGHWVTAKSIPGRAFYFETFLPRVYISNLSVVWILKFLLVHMIL